MRWRNRFLGMKGDIDWTLERGNPTPLDFFLWDYLKKMFEVNKLTTIAE